MTRSVRLVLTLLLATLLLPIAQPSHAQDQQMFFSASMRYGFMAPPSWVGTHRPVVGLQFGVPSESVTLASSQASLDIFVAGAPSFFFDKYNYDFGAFEGAVIAATLWPSNLEDDVYLDDYDLRYGLEYIHDDYGDVQEDVVAIGPFSGTRYSRTWRGLTFSYYWLTNAPHEVLLVSALGDATHAELTASIIDGLSYTAVSAEDLVTPFDDTPALTLTGGVQVNLPRGWWSLGGVQGQYLTILGPNADLLRATAFRYGSTALTSEGVVVGSYRWTLAPDTDWTTAAAQQLGVDLTLTSNEPIPLVSGQSTISFTAQLPDFWGGYTASGRGIVWEGEGEVTALLALGDPDYLATYAANINAIFASASLQNRATSDSLRTVTPRSGRYALDVPENWTLSPAGSALDFSFGGIFPDEGIMITSNPDTLAFMGDNILSSWDFVGYDAVPADIGVLVGTILPAEVLAMLQMDVAGFDALMMDDMGDDVTQIPLELRGLTGNRYELRVDAATQASYIIMGDADGNLYFFVMAATGRDYERYLAALESMRLQPLEGVMSYELAPQALMVEVPTGWWSGDALLNSYVDQRVPIISPSPLLAGVLSLSEPEDWEYDLPGLTASQLQGIVFGGMTFTDLSGIEALVGADGTINTAALAQLVLAEIEPEATTLVVGDITDWSNGNGLSGTQVEFDLSPYFTLDNGSGTVAIHGYVVGVSVPQGLAVMVALTSADQVEQNRALVDDVFNSARLK